MTKQQTICVKAFVETSTGPLVFTVPLLDMNEAIAMFDEHRANTICQAAYIYRGDRIVASWDRHADYLMAIGDIQPDDELLYHRFLYDSEVQP